MHWQKLIVLPSIRTSSAYLRRCAKEPEINTKNKNKLEEQRYQKLSNEIHSNLDTTKNQHKQQSVTIVEI